MSSIQKIKSPILFFIRLRKLIKRKLWTAVVRLTCNKHGKVLYVNAKSWIGGNVTLGENCNFNGMNISSGGKVCIGNNFHSGADCKIIVQYHNYNQGKAIPYDDSYINKNVTIDDNVWIGERVIILGNVTIGEGAIIQAGSVVVSNIPKYAIAGGNPARVFKMRDIEHYERLKQLGKFH